jgi:hypothetical protein
MDSYQHLCSFPVPCDDSDDWNSQVVYIVSDVRELDHGLILTLKTETQVVLLHVQDIPLPIFLCFSRGNRPIFLYTVKCMRSANSLTIVQFDVHLQKRWLYQEDDGSPSRFCASQTLGKLLASRMHEVIQTNIVLPCLGETHPHLDIVHQQHANKRQFLHGWIKQLDIQFLQTKNHRLITNFATKKIAKGKIFVYQCEQISNERPSTNQHFLVEQVAAVINGQTAAVHTSTLVRAFSEVTSSSPENCAIMDCNIVFIHPWSIMRWKPILEQYKKSYLFISDRDTYNQTSIRDYANYDYLIISNVFFQSAYYRHHAHKTFQKRLFVEYFKQTDFTHKNYTEVDAQKLCSQLLAQTPRQALPSLLKQTPFHFFTWKRCIIDDSIKIPAEKPVQSLSTWLILNRQGRTHSAVMPPLVISDMLLFCYSHSEQNKKPPNLLSVHDPGVCALLQCCLFDYQEDFFMHCASSATLEYNVLREVDVLPRQEELNVFYSLRQKLSRVEELLFWLNPAWLGLTEDSLLSVFTPQAYKEHVLAKTCDCSSSIHDMLLTLRKDLQSLKNLTIALGQAEQPVQELIGVYEIIARSCGYANLDIISSQAARADDCLHALLQNQLEFLFLKTNKSVEDLRDLVTTYKQNEKKTKYLQTVLGSSETLTRQACPICLENKTNIVIDCGHIFCYDCIMTSLDISLECPVCKQEPNDLSRVVEDMRDAPNLNYSETALFRFIDNEVENGKKRFFIICEVQIQAKQIHRLLRKQYYESIIVLWSHSLPSVDVVQEAEILLTSLTHGNKEFPTTLGNFTDVFLLLSPGKKSISQTYQLQKLVDACSEDAVFTKINIALTLEDEEV